MRRISKKCLARFRIGPSVLWIRIRIDFGRQIRIQKVKNDPQKFKGAKKFHVLKCWMFSLGLKASPVARTSFFLLILAIKPLDLDPHWPKILAPIQDLH
jgi:hypothetical protein